MAAAKRKPTAIAIARSVFISAPHTRGRRSSNDGYTTKRKSLSRRGFMIMNSRTFRRPLVSFVFSRLRGKPTPRASGAQGVVQFPNQTLRPRNRVGRIVPSLSLLLVQVIRYVQGRENGNFCRIDCRRSLGDLSHARIDEPGQVVDVGAVAFGADVVGLPEDLHLSHAAPSFNRDADSFRGKSLVSVLSWSQQFRSSSGRRSGSRRPAGTGPQPFETSAASR